MASESKSNSAHMTPGQAIADATVWGREDYPDDRSWVRPIPDVVIEELARGLPRLRSMGLHPSAIRPEHLEMPASRPFLEQVERDIELGPGFALLGGFPVERFDGDDRGLAYCALMSNFGNVAIQSRAGEFVVDVSDKGRGLGPQARGHYGNSALPFHADGANAVSLLCVRTAPTGGRSLIVSGAAIYNAVLGEHPEYLPILERGFHHHRREERDVGDPLVTPWRTPVFAYYDSRFHIVYVRPSIDYCADEGIVITEAERCALDFLDEVIARPSMQVSMALQPGDIQILNNFLVLHSRTAYEDSSEQQRHLVRLWLDNEAALRNGPGKMDWYMPEHSRFLRTRGELLEGFSIRS